MTQQVESHGGEMAFKKRNTAAPIFDLASMQTSMDASAGARRRGERMHTTGGEMRQDPKIFYGRESATGGLEDVTSVPFTVHTLSRAGIHVEGNDLWRMAENGWLEVLDRGTQNTHKGRFLWYRRVPIHTMSITEMLQLLDAQSRLR